MWARGLWTILVMVTLPATTPPGCLSRHHRSSANSLDEPVDKGAWVDLNDMGMAKESVADKSDQNPLSPTHMINKVAKNVADKDGQPDESSGSATNSMHPKIMQLSNCGDISRELDRCRRSLKELQQELAPAELDKSAEGEDNSSPQPVTSQTDQLFFRRFVKFVVRTLDLEALQEAPGHEQRHEMQARLSLSAADAAVLVGFANEKKVRGKHSFSDVDHVLTSMFKEVIPMSDDDARCKSSFPSLGLPRPEDLFYLSLALFALWAVTSLWRGVAVWKVLTALLVASSAWHWMHLYRKALSRKHSVLVKEEGVPAECFPDQMGWGRFFFDRVFASGDRCAEYHDALLVDPLWEVSPTMAVAETIVQFVLLPLEHLGRHLGKFFAGLLGELSWMSSPSILLFTFVAMLLCLVMAFGYRFRLPLFLGTFEPRERDSDRDSETVGQLKREIERLCLQVSEQQATLQARAQPNIQSLEMRDNSSTEETKQDGESENLVVVGAHTSPRKRLIVRGSISSPKETDFEWVEEKEEEQCDEERVQDLSFACSDNEAANSDCLDAAESKDAKDPEGGEVEASFLERIETVFQEKKDNSAFDN